MTLDGLRLSLGVLTLPVLVSFSKPPFREVTIEATNYAFKAPTVLPRGLTAFRLANHGTVPHEVQLFRVSPSVTADSAMKLMAKDGIPDNVGDTFGSVLIAGPGQTPTERILIDLKKNEVYALICGFRDTPTSPKHRTLGMFATFTVN